MTKSSPIRLQRRRTSGFNLQKVSLSANGRPAVCVGRPSILGNPFSIAEFGRDWAVELHSRWLEGELRGLGEKGLNALAWFNGDWCDGKFREFQGVPFTEWHMIVRDLAAERLRGKNVACWCRKDQACHGDNLLQWAES